MNKSRSAQQFRPQKPKERSMIMIPCMNCQEFFLQDEIDKHSQTCLQVNKSVAQMDRSGDVFEENNFRLNKIRLQIQYRNYENKQRLLRIIELASKIQTIGCIEENSLQELAQELQTLSQQEVQSLNYSLHLERVHSLILMRISIIQKALQQRTIQHQTKNINQPTLSKQSTRTTQRQFESATNNPKTFRASYQNFFSQQNQQINYNPSLTKDMFLKQSSIMSPQQQQSDNGYPNIQHYLSPQGRQTYITKFSSNQQNMELQQKSELLTHISNSSQFGGDSHDQSNQKHESLMREFYNKCLNKKLRLRPNDPGQKLPLSLLFKEYQMVQDQKTQERFIADAYANPFLYIDPQKIYK